MKKLVIVIVFFVGCYANLFKFPDSDPCIMVQVNASLALRMTENTTILKADAVLDGNTAPTSSCDSADTRNIDIALRKEAGFKGIVGITFKKSLDSDVKMDISLSFIPKEVFNNNQDTMPKMLNTASSISLSSENASYTCTAGHEIMFTPLNASGVIYDFKMTISQVQIQAFHIKKGVFSPAEDCTDVKGSTEGPTTEPATTQPPTTQSTTVPQTTTEAPVTNKTTSETPTTSEAPTTTVITTEPPTTIVTTVVPTTTMNPGPTPKPGSPDTNTYTADTVNTTCLLLKAGIEFTVPYIATDGASKTVVVGIPKGFTVKGNCNGTNTTQSLSVSFYNNQWNLTMIFAASSDQFYMSEVDLNAVIDSSVIKDIKNTEQVKINKMFGSDQFSAAKTGSYKCSADTTLTLNGTFLMNTYNLQYAAFQTFPKNTTDFTDNNISECSGDTTTNSVVPIAVGAALAGLVVIVLIAYLIGRRRSRAAGYEQV